MRDNTKSRHGLWYPRYFMALSAYQINDKKWKVFEIDERSPIVFVRDTMETEGMFKGSHILIVRLTAVMYPRINNARWRKKFER